MKFDWRQRRVKEQKPASWANEPEAERVGERSVQVEGRKDHPIFPGRTWNGGQGSGGGRGRWVSVRMLDASQQICLFLDLSASRLHGSRGCLGCCAKPTPIIAVDEPSKGLKIQGRTIKKPSMSDDFWSTSTYEMENSGVQSQRSISSISISAQNLDHHGAGSTSNPSEFINHGLLLWNQTRQQWIGNKRHETQLQHVREPRLSWNATYDSLLGINKPFPQPIPLSEMVDFLVDIWEQEGLYD
ncbi:uncharacterized protein [Elaeis guineensis]|uniref:uncharacterized protein isoform X2 n=1 Tax=Elaeis guineensis var. tenera TaxID=51953 RepID=UPI003C6D597C